MFELPPIDEIVALALAEDLGMTAADVAQCCEGGDLSVMDRDVTASSTVGEDARFVGHVVARDGCVVCGLPVAAAVFDRFSSMIGLFEPVDFFPLVAEGSRVEPGTRIAEVDGLATAALACERTALNFLMVLSGIATETARWVAEAGTLAVCDTRKTYPGLRALSKYAVRVGGGTNHRMGLHDMVLIKDNHIRHAGGLGAAVRSAKSEHPGLAVEAEADTVEQAVEAVAAGADIVMLDNMDAQTRARAVQACRAEEDKRGVPLLLEISGGVRLEGLAELRASGVDRVSSSALTLAAPVDLALDETGRVSE